MASTSTSPTSGPATIAVVCAGSPSEMGEAQGAGLRDKIRAARRDLARLEAFRLPQPRWLPYTLYRWLAEQKASRYLDVALRRDFPEMSQRLTAIARGAGIRLPAVHLFNALEPLLSSLGGCTACPGACSAAAIRGAKSVDGQPVLSRNFDYLPLVQPYYVMRDCRPAGKLRSLEFTGAPLGGAVDGMNERGLCITYDYAFTTDQGPDARAPISMGISRALESCSTVTEAADCITSRPRWGGGLLMLADASGDIASLELSATRHYLRRPSPGEDTLFHTNAFVSESLRAVQIPDEAVFSDVAPEPLRGRRLHLSSELRDARFRQLLDTPTPLAPSDLHAIMSDHGAEGIPGDNTPCVHGTYWFTTACLQFLPRARRMRVAYATACQAQFAEFGL